MTKGKAIRRRYWSACEKALLSGEIKLGVEMIVAVVGNDVKRASKLLTKAEGTTHGVHA